VLRRPDCFSGSFGPVLLLHRELICPYRFKLLLNPTEGIAGGEEGDSESIIRSKALERGVLALPGTVFLPNGRKTAYVRAAFSLTEKEDVDEAVKRIRDVILDARAAAVLAS
jgi:tryptophan aminotransferase